MRIIASMIFVTLCLSTIIAKESEKKSIQKPIIKEAKKTVNCSIPLVLVIMVKNEEHVIEKTLEPFLKAKVPCLVCDTGSTDNTIKITREVFEKYKSKQSCIVQQPFVDFSVSRNYALECAEKNFTNAGFFIMIDADWYVQNVQQLIDFCKDHISDQTEAYSIRIRYNNSEYFVKRVLKADKKVRFVRPIHESVKVSTSKRLPDDIYIKWDDSAKGYEKSKARWTRDKAILIKENEKNPNDLLNIFYMAQTYGDLREYDNAIIWYKKVLSLKENYDEEKLSACYRIALIYDHLGNWPLALDFYLKAYSLNPKRAESLVNLAQHYLKTKEYSASYLFAKQACQISYPVDAYWKDKDAYMYRRYDILAAVAWPLGYYEEGEKALRKALESNPKDAHLIANLKVYQDRKNPKVSQDVKQAKDKNIKK